MTDSLHIIAEAGYNHNGSIDRAIELVELARRSGADSVKFQIINTSGLYLPGKYEFGKYDIEEVRKQRDDYALSYEEYRRIDQYCRESSGPLFSASIFDEDGLSFYDSLNPPYFKIASTDLNNVSLLRKLAQRKRRIILSTGMSTLGEIEKAVHAVSQVHSDIVIMHCVSAYPSRLEDMNLSFIETLKQAFGFPVGLSDHTPGVEAACMAVALGVVYIEKHVTTDKSLPGFDHSHSMDEAEFTSYVSTLRKAFMAMQRQQTKLKEAERTVARRARRSLYAARDLKPGDIVREEDILVVRPLNDNPFTAGDFDLIVGRAVAKDIAAYERFDYGNLQFHS